MQATGSGSSTRATTADRRPGAMRSPMEWFPMSRHRTGSGPGAGCRVRPAPFADLPCGGEGPAAPGPSPSSAPPIPAVGR